MTQKETITLVCPDCLVLDKEVVLGELQRLEMSGKLECEECGAEYDVVEGIPILVPALHSSRLNLPDSSMDQEHLQYETKATKRVADILANNSSRLALDVGCGKGPYTDCFEGVNVELDINYYFVDQARRAGSNETGDSYGVVADARYLPFARDTFDLVFSSNLVEHLPAADIEKALAGMKRVGCDSVQIDVPNEKGFIKLVKRIATRLGLYGSPDYEDESLTHQSHFSPADLRRMGFEVFGCVGWVTRERIDHPRLWSVYDRIVWRIPWFAGTLIGIIRMGARSPCRGDKN